MKLAGIAALVLVPMLTLTTTASAATQTATYKLRATAIGQSADFTLDQGLDSTAPATVAPGAVFSVVIDPAPNAVPAKVKDYTVREIKKLVLKLTVPANAKFQSAKVSGGAGLGSTPTVAVEGNNVVLKIAGPIKGGSAFELPTITVTLQAGGTGDIVTKLTGTSYTDPGLTFTAAITAFGFPIDAPATGYPDPNPPLTTTTIG